MLPSGMHIISPQHLAELLIGIAHAQAAIVQALGSEDRVERSLRKVAHPTLIDFPAQILLATLTGDRPDAAAIAEDLERILGGTPGSPGRDLDFGGTPP